MKKEKSEKNNASQKYQKKNTQNGKKKEAKKERKRKKGTKKERERSVKSASKNKRKDKRKIKRGTSDVYKGFLNILKIKSQRRGFLLSKNRARVLLLGVLIIIGVVFFSLVLFVPPQQSAQKQSASFSPIPLNTYNNLYQKGVDAISSRDFKTAYEIFQKLVRKEPKNIDYKEKLALCQYNLQDYKGAIKTYKEILALDSKNAFIYNSLGNAFRDNNDMKAAEKAYQKSVEINPYLIAAYTNLAWLYLKENNIKRAREIILEGSQANPENKTLQQMLNKIGSKNKK